jgi:hypothetical protein
MKTLLRNLAILSLPLTIAGCDVQIDSNQTPIRTEANSLPPTSTPQPTSTPDKYSFNKFGYVGEVSGNGLTLVLGDLDNDGSLDIVAMDSQGTITIYQNKIPQQNHNQQKPTSSTLEKYK